MKKILFPLVVFISGIAQADLSRTTIFSLNTIYIDRDYTDNGVNTKIKETDTDLRLMRVEKKWAYGDIYSKSANDSSSASRTSTGLSVGYYSEKDFYLNLHYFLNSKYSSTGVEYSKGSGYEIDLGFLSKITSSFYAGLVIARKEFKYSEQTSTGMGFPPVAPGTSTAEVSHHELIPMFTFAVVFQ